MGGTESAHRDERLLLRLLREPESIIQRVEETCEIGGATITRRVDVLIDPAVTTGGADHIYLDLVHPEKGLMHKLSLDESFGAQIVDHDTHRRLARAMILYRFGTVVQSISNPETVAGPARWLMLQLMLELGSLPYQTRTDAEKNLRRHFDGKRLRLFEELKRTAGMNFKKKRVGALYRLCKRLTYKYLLLARVPVDPKDGGRVRFSYDHEISEPDIYREGWRRFAPLRRYLWFASSPTAFRIHTPWAKRTNHYSMFIEAPPGQFFSTTTLLEQTATSDEANAVTPLSVVDYNWSMNGTQGRVVNVFMGGARTTVNRLFVGIRMLELPGRSTSRALALALSVALLLSVFTMLIFVSTGPIVDAAAIVLALLAVGAFASSPPPGDLVLGPPILSRVASLCLGFACTVFVLWYTSLVSDVSEDWIAAEVRDGLQATWLTWKYWGWLPLVAGAWVLTAWLSGRWVKHVWRYRDARDAADVVNMQFT